MNAGNTKTCPDCAEEIKAEARACRYCGYRFDGPIAEPVLEGDETASVDSDAFVAVSGDPAEQPRAPAVEREAGPKVSGRNWKGFARYAGAVALWLLVAYPAGVSVADSTGVGDIVSGVLASAFVSLALAVVARLIYAKIRKKTFRSAWVFVLAAAVALASAAGQAAQQAQQADEPGSADARPGQSPEAVVASGGSKASQEWVDAAKEIDPLLSQILAGHVAFQQSFSNQMTNEFSIAGVAAPDRSNLAQEASGVRKALKQALDLARNLPANSSSESEVNVELADLVTLGVAGYDDYDAGLRTASDALIRDADDSMGRFFVQVGPVRRALFDLYGEPNLDPRRAEVWAFGDAILRVQPEINSYNRLQGRFIRQLQERPFVLSKARSTVVRARALARRIATDIQNIEPPTDPTLRTAQTDFTNGWALIAEGSGDYIAALDSGNDRLFFSGDAKLNRAARLHQRAQREILSLASG